MTGAPRDPYDMFAGAFESDERELAADRHVAADTPGTRDWLTPRSARAAARTSTRRRPQRGPAPAAEGVRVHDARHDVLPPRRSSRSRAEGQSRVPGERAATRRAPHARPGHRRANPFRRLRGALVVVVVLFSVVVVRLGQLQVTGEERLADLGTAQTVRSLELPAARGAIFDRNGEDLALSLPTQSVWVDPRHVEDPDGTAALLAPVLGVDEAELRPRLVGEGAFAYLSRQVDPAVAEAVTEMSLPGVQLMEEPSRYRPAGDLARSLLGDVNVDDQGRSGLELLYDDVLTGTPGQRVVERDPSGRTIPQGQQALEPAVPGDDLVLTIDRSLQYEAERALADQIAAMGAAGGSLVAADPTTGEILAMASLVVPDGGGVAVPAGYNRALVDVFEPGSVNKVITMSAALEEGVATPETSLVVPDHLQVSDHTFEDSHSHPTESYTPTDILATSSNVGTILLAQQLGAERVDDYMRRFGFGSLSGLGFPDESPGIMLDPEDWSGTAIGSIPIGQTIAVNALQMLDAFNVIANDGVLASPSLVRGRIDALGAEHTVGERTSERVVSPETARSVRDMLVAVVESGTGAAAAIDGYAVAGKTGTARKPQPGGGYERPGGGYDYVTTFAGFVPAQDPQLSVIVVIDEPTTSIYASQASAPVFSRFAQYALRHLDIPPAGTPYEYTVPLARVTEEPVTDPVDPDARVRSEAATVTPPPGDEDGAEAAGDGTDDDSGAAPPEGET